MKWRLKLCQTCKRIGTPLYHLFNVREDLNRVKFWSSTCELSEHTHVVTGGQTFLLQVMEFRGSICLWKPWSVVPECGAVRLPWVQFPRPIPLEFSVVAVLRLIFATHGWIPMVFYRIVRPSIKLIRVFVRKENPIYMNLRQGEYVGTEVDTRTFPEVVWLSSPTGCPILGAPGRWPGPPDLSRRSSWCSDWGGCANVRGIASLSGLLDVAQSTSISSARIFWRAL